MVKDPHKDPGPLRPEDAPPVPPKVEKKVHKTDDSVSIDESPKDKSN